MKDPALLKSIRQILKTGDERYRDRLFFAAENCKDGMIDLSFASALWNGLIQLEKCSNDKLVAVLQAWVPEYRPPAKSSGQILFEENFDEIINADIKKKFLDESSYDEKKHSRACKLFVRISLYEKEKGKDISLFEKEELLDVIQEQEFNKKTQVTEFFGVISKYSKWRKTEGLPVGDAFFGSERISPKNIILDNVNREGLIYSSKELARKIREEENEPGSLGGAILCLSWLGFTYEEMLLIKDKDVKINGDHGFVLGIRIPDELIPIVKDYIEADQKGVVTGFGTGKIVKREESDFFLKRWLTRKNMGERNANFLANNMREFSMTHREVRKSGILHRLYAKEKAEGDITESDIEEAFNLTRTPQSAKTTDYLVRQNMDIYIRYKKLLSMR